MVSKRTTHQPEEILEKMDSNIESILSILQEHHVKKKEEDGEGEEKKDEPASEIIEKYSYTGDDFGSQNYDTSKEDIISGEFLVKLKDQKGNIVGQISWQSLAPAVKEDPSWSVHETVTLSLGIGNNAKTWSGSAHNVAVGGFYDEGVDYNFHMIGEHYSGYGSEIDVTITNIGEGNRVLTLTPHSEVHHDEHSDEKKDEHSDEKKDEHSDEKKDESAEPNYTHSNEKQPKSRGKASIPSFMKN